ncbi:MAG: hypothetical protein IKD68_04110, partial [Solobacterium sp.]|nr:hypothetical protein [Solobacterium sp.]
MKVLLYFESESLIQTSGIGRAFEHQKTALASQGISYTTDPWDEDYDILHINTCGIIFTEDPFLLVVFTDNVGTAYDLISECCM